MRYDFVEEIKSILDSSKFDSDDFEISVTARTVTVEYIYSKGYTFRFNIPDSKEEIVDNNSVSFGLQKNTKWVYVFSGSFKPGKYSYSESFKYYGFDDIRREVINWSNYLYEELRRISEKLNIKSVENDEEFEKYKSQFENIEKLIDERIDDSEMFSPEDKEYFNNKLNEFKSEFEEQLKKVISEQEDLQAELDKVNKDFSKLKDSLNYMSKKNWGKKFLSKTKDFFKDDKKRKIVFTIAKGANILLKKYDITIPLLSDGIDTIEELSEKK